MKKRVSAILWVAFGSMVIYTGCSKNIYLKPHTPNSNSSTDVRVVPFRGDTVVRGAGLFAWVTEDGNKKGAAPRPPQIVIIIKGH